MAPAQAEITTVADVAEALRIAAATVKTRRARPLPLDLGALGAILSVDELSGIAHVEVGVTLGRLEQTLAPAGLTLRHDPPLPPEATVASQLGALSGSICGLEACLADGRMVRLRPGPRRAVGPDLISLVTLDAPRLLVVCAVYLRVARSGEEPWVGWFRASGADAALAALRAALRRGVRPVAIELRVESGGAVARVELNLPAPARAAHQAVFEEEMTRAGAEPTAPAAWAPFEDVGTRWLPFGDLPRAVRRPPVRVVAFTPWGAEVQFTRSPPATPRVNGPTPSFEALLTRLETELDPKGLL